MQWYWEPKPDITLHELAQALGVLLPLVADASPEKAEHLVARCPPNVARHFTRKRGGETNEHLRCG